MNAKSRKPLLSKRKVKRSAPYTMENDSAAADESNVETPPPEITNAESVETPLPTNSENPVKPLVDKYDSDETLASGISEIGPSEMEIDASTENEKSNDVPPASDTKPNTFPYAKSFTEHDEYYPSSNYAVDANGMEKYAQDRFGQEFYMLDANNRPVFTKNEKGERVVYAKLGGYQVYPLDENKEPIFSVGNEGQVYFVNDEGAQVYPESADGSREIYAINAEKKEFFALNEGGFPYYASKNVNGDAVEYAPQDEFGNIYLISKGDDYLYPMNRTTQRIEYPKDENGNTKYSVDAESNEIYFKNQLGNEIYGLDVFGYEQPARVNDDRVWRYAKDQFGDEIYPKDNLGNEYYLFKDSQQYCAVRKDGFSYYAKRADGGEFYPRKLNL